MDRDEKFGDALYELVAQYIRDGGTTKAVAMSLATIAQITASMPREAFANEEENEQTN